MLSYILLPVGLLVLLKGGDWLVKGAAGLAQRFRVPPLVIGLTIVAFGTSAPELVISLDAALIGAGGIAIGNVVGSNIANVLLVLAVPALIAPIMRPEDRLGPTLAFLTLITLFLMWRMSSGTLTRLDGVLLLAALAVYLALQVRRSGGAASGSDLSDEVGPVPTEGWKLAALLVVGLLSLPLGAKLTVDSAVSIARALDVSDEVIGLTIVAIGTSLPELATGISAARQGAGSVAMGNVIGSNFFNIAGILGITATVTSIPVTSHIVTFDMWVMLAATLFLVALAVFDLRIGRRVGGSLLAAYIVYLVATAVLT